MKKLCAITLLLAIILIILSVLLAFTGNATVINDVAIDQLNGGNEAYIAMQVYTQYRNTLIEYRDTLLGIATFITVIIVVLVSIMSFKNIKERKNNFKK
jgi:ABC-type spermidine/putrescine transport system permease subunit II